MTSTDTRALLARFVRDGSHDAFRGIVEQHVDIVHAAALRQVNGDAALAEDVTQQVFASLAAKARHLPAETVLAGWLYRHACYTGARAARTEKRRRLREQQHAMMNAPTSPDDDAWSEITPHLDEAIASLPAADRDMVVLRFFSRQDFRSLGSTFGISDDTAQKRVSRALEKLRAFLSGRGVTGGAVAALALLLSSRAAPAAPAALSSAVALDALTLAARGGAPAGMAAVAWWKWAALAAGVAAAGAIVVQQREIQHLRAQLHAPESRPPAASTLPPGRAAAVTAQPGADVLSLDEILQRAAVLAAQGGQAPPKDKAEIASLLGSVAPGDYPAAMEKSLALTDDRARRRLAVDFLTRWAASQPDAAWRFVRAAMSGRERTEALERILRTWAADAPAAAAQAVREELAATPVTVPPAPERQSLIATLCQGMGRADAAAAWQAFAAFTDDDDKAAALAALIPAAGFPPGGHSTLWAAVSAAPLSARQKLEEDFATLCLRSDIRAASDWAAALTDAAENSRAISLLGSAWARREPAQALAWSLTASAPQQRAARTAELIATWAARDLNAAGAWLNAQPRSSDTDPARARMATLAVPHDPASAMAWARSLSDETARASAVQQTWEKWRALDPQAAGPSPPP